MRKKYCFIVILFLHFATFCQQKVNRQQFFLDERVIDATLTTEIKKIRNDKNTPAWQPANIVMRFSDTSVITEDIRIQPRGQFRKNNCDMASLMLNFKNPSSPKLSHLKKLKLVGGCHRDAADEELLLKEYLIYKLYNFITNMSFRVRLMHITYKDSKEKMKSYTQYAFLIEDMNDMLERNNCVEIKNTKFGMDGLNSQQFTLMCMFQYMVGNTDWSLPNYHNIKLMVPKTDTFAAPYIVAYDFDFSGIVDASYAAPDEQFHTTSVKERVYRGYPQTTIEIQKAIAVFTERKERIMYYLNNFTLLTSRTKKDVLDYIEEFYKTIESKSSLRSVFNAKKE